MYRNQKGIAHVVLILCCLALITAVGFIVFQAVGKKADNRENAAEKGESTGAGWQWDGQKWVSNSRPPKCPDPLVVKSPVDVTKASAVLYPGQVRGNYKSHGGFRFDALSSNNIEVVAPLDAKLVEASRYIENGEVQYYFIFINDCGIAYRLDHLLRLTPEFQAVANKLPEAKENDSRTTRLESPVSVKTGEKIATAVGFSNPLNVSVDFGLYDLRQPNGKTINEAGRDQYGAQFNAYGLCWFENLNQTDSNIVKGLPAGDGQSGKTSDYCS